MNTIADDLKRLRWSLLLLLLAALVGGGAVLAARALVARGEADNQRLTAQLSDISSRLGRAREEESDIRGRIALYQQLVERGIVGPESRLDWVEAIGRAAAERRLPGLEYEILPQAPLAAELLPPGPQGGLHEIMASPLRLHLALLHENDLLLFLEDLRTSLRAHLLIRECSIDRNPPPVASRGPAPHLRAECLLDLVTFRAKP